jgi:hypothetical protein
MVLSLLKRKERQDVLGEDVGAVEPPLMKNAVNRVQKQPLGLIERLQSEQILGEFWHFTHVEHLQGIANVPKSEGRG